MMSENQSTEMKKRWLLIVIIAVIAIGAYNHWFSSDAYEKQGDELFKKGKYDEALVAYTKAIEKNPKNPDLYFQRASVYEFKSILLKSILDEDESVESAVLSDYGMAINAAPRDVRTYLRRAEFCIEKKKYEWALADINKAFEIVPESAKAYSLRGRVRNAQGDYGSAIADFTQAILFGSNDSYSKLDDRLRRGDAYRDAGDYTQALVDYTDVINRDEKKVLKFDKARAYFGRGYIYYHQKDIVSAIENYTKAIEFENSDAGAYNNRGICYEAQGNDAQAVADYTKAIELRPNDALYYKNRGKARRRLGNTAQADADLAKAEELRQKE